MRAGYLGRVFVTEHAPVGKATGTGVVIVPPHGWDEAASYRARRWLAEQLASQGHLAARLDLPGCGDSAGQLSEDGSVANWQSAVDDVVAAVRGAGCARVVAVGFGMGGFLAAESSADELVLWGTPARGRQVVRELSAFAKLEQGNAPHPDGLWVYGDLLAQTTVEELSAIDLRVHDWHGLRRALVLGRDGIPADAELVASCRAAGVDVTTGAGKGWAELMVEPHRARLPMATLEQVITWIAADAVGPQGGAVSALPLIDELEIPGGVERAVTVAAGGLQLPAVLASPSAVATRTVLLLNAGALRRSGPHRAWVAAARRWVGQGVASLRVDLPGIGDAPGQEPDDEGLYGSEYDDVVAAVLDALPGLGVPSDVTSMGLCSGAYLSYNAARADARVGHVVLLNPKSLVWHPTRAALDGSRELRKVLSPTRWRKALAGQLRWSQLREPLRAGVRRLVQLPVAAAEARRVRALRRQGLDPVVAGFDEIAARGGRATLVFSAEETLRAELGASATLSALQQHPAVDVWLLEGDVETHTLSPARVRHEVDAIVDAAVLGVESGSA